MAPKVCLFPGLYTNWKKPGTAGSGRWRKREVSQATSGKCTSFLKALYKLELDWWIRTERSRMEKEGYKMAQSNTVAGLVSLRRMLCSSVILLHSACALEICHCL